MNLSEERDSALREFPGRTAICEVAFSQCGLFMSLGMLTMELIFCTVPVMGELTE